MLIPLFINNLLPILLSAGAGFILSRRVELDPQPINRAVFYIFSPCLVFTLLYTSNLDLGDSATIGGLVFAGAAANLLLAWTVARVMKLDRKTSAALALTVLIPNAGNYGLSLNKFAFGEEALAAASIFFASISILLYTVGILIASMGQSTFGESVRKLFTFPTIYAVVLAFALKSFHWTLPIPFDRAITLLGEASIPCMLIVLGIQLGRQSKLVDRAPVLAAGLGLRLIASPLIAIALAMVFHLEDG